MGSSSRATSIVLLLGVLSCQAADVTVEDEARSLERRAVALGVVNRLQITREQAESLLDVAKEEADLQATYERKRQRLMEEELGVFAEFKAEDLQNTGFTPRVEGATGQADGREKALFKEFADQIAVLDDKAPLSQEQRDLLQRFRDDKLGAFLRKEPPTGRPESEAERLQDQLAEIHHEEYGEIGPVGRFLLWPGAIEVLAQRAGKPSEPVTATGGT